MILSTLPDLPGQTFTVVGMVFAQATLNSIGGGNTQNLVSQITQQAQQFGANGIVDVKVVGAGNSGTFIMTGTAVKIN
ncbi:MAG: hypothetical protein H0X24_09280 [Ktedonobacterales bacterium]|nr:hypothetical protein [Ktedonobacterales bacterium]